MRGHGAKEAKGHGVTAPSEQPGTDPERVKEKVPSQIYETDTLPTALTRHLRARFRISFGTNRPASW